MPFHNYTFRDTEISLTKLLQVLQTKASRPSNITTQSTASKHKPPKDYEWYEADVVQVEKDQWSTQPLNGLCLLCGQSVQTLTLVENMTREEVIDKCRHDRSFFAKVLLLHQIQEGSVPKGFECSIVRTIHAVGQKSEQHCRAVNTRHFIAHKDLNLNPSTLPGNRMEQQEFAILNSELGVDSCVAFSPDESMPSDLPFTDIQLYHRTESQLVEYQLVPKQHLLKNQAKEMFKITAQDNASNRPDALRASRIFRPWSFNKWKK